MPEIAYNDVNRHLGRAKQGDRPSVYLVHGEAYLVEETVSSIIDAILPDPADRGMCLETVDMADGESIYDIVERINTLSFFQQKKVLRLKGDLLFAKGGRPEKDTASTGPPEGSPGAPAILKDTVQRGFPEGHVLVITTGPVDRRTALYKAVNAAHWVVDCSVPAGSRKADVDRQKQVLRGLMNKILAKHGKDADPDVFDRVFTLTGFEPRVFSGSIEKLVQFAGASPRIRAVDAATVLDKTREDPVYDFTGAIFEKNPSKALYYLSTLMASGFHPVQLLTAINSQLRKLLMVKFFTESPQGKSWQPGMRFDSFKKQVMPAVVHYDQALAAKAAKDIAERDENEGAAPGKPKMSTDLAIVKNPNNPYPVYQMFLQADRFSARRLKDLTVALGDADVRLKTSAGTPRAVLESLVLNICRTDKQQPE